MEKFSTWLENKIQSGAPKCEKCGKSMIWSPAPKYKMSWWGKDSSDRGPKWLNKGKWICTGCKSMKVPEPEISPDSKKKLSDARKKLINKI